METKNNSNKKWKMINNSIYIIAVIAVIAIIYVISEKDKAQFRQEYIQTKVVEMYADVPENFTKIMNNEISGSGDFRRMLDKMDYLKQEVAGFNENCRAKVLNDEALKDYFERFIGKLDENKLSIDNMNFYSLSLRASLQKDLQISGLIME